MRQQAEWLCAEPMRPLIRGEKNQEHPWGDV